MSFHNYSYSVVERFLRYVQIDTQSDPSVTRFPSTEKQKDLANLLVNELRQLGVEDVEMDEWGYVYATIPANSAKMNIPTICFCSHMDTSPDCSGTNVKPVIHRNYDGGNILFEDDSALVLNGAKYPQLNDKIGEDIITASGTTLLGADNKAGVAEIMDAIQYWLTHDESKHGDIRILFTPDEEVGRGTEKVDIKKLNAVYGYTIDGENVGDIEDETFSADAVSIIINGVSTHPGMAKGKLENAIKIASEIVSSLPKDKLSPETTENREGFIHPTNISGTLERAEVHFIIRDFEICGLQELEDLLKAKAEAVLSHYPHSSMQFVIKEQYRNMKEVLKHHPKVIEYAMEAVRRAGVQPHLQSIRGGTDGSRLSFMGLPCANIFAGEHAFHSKLEWVSVQDMQKAVQTIVHLAEIWEEKA